MRPRAQTYRTLDGLSAERNAVPWYWRMVAIASSFFILGGFLMLPGTFYKDKTNLRVSQAGVGIFAVALLTAGFSLTGLLCFAVRNTLFQAESIFLPALLCCCLGLATILYDFVVFSLYTYNTPALLTTIAAAVSSVTYGTLLIYTQRKISGLTATNRTSRAMQMEPTGPPESEASPWQDPAYYENYVRNMYPSSARAAPPQTGYGGYDPHAITEEEMQRQQMLMLLLQNNAHQPGSPAPPSSSTYNIDWQGRDDEEAPPLHGYYAPQTQVPTPQTAFTPRPGFMRQLTNELQPWDGVWRAPARVSASTWQRPPSAELREARRREIETGVR